MSLLVKCKECGAKFSDGIAYCTMCGGIDLEPDTNDPALKDLPTETFSQWEERRDYRKQP